MNRGYSSLALAAPLVLGVLLAISNVRLTRENRRLSDLARYYSSLRHTRSGVKLPDLHGTGLDGRDLTIPVNDGKRDTVLLVFSPTCPHCKRNWPVWLDLVRGAAADRVAFVNVGPPLPVNFSQLYSFDTAAVMSQTSPETVLAYSFLEFPLTILMSPDGRTQKVWVGELSSADVAEIKQLAGWQAYQSPRSDVQKGADRAHQTSEVTK